MSAVAVIDEYVYRYPQLTLPIEEGMGKSERYKEIVLRGKLPSEYSHSFRGSREDAVYRIPIPAGEAEVLYLAVREDFERMVQGLAYRCENTPVPPSMGAVTIRGIYNWRKIHSHKKEYLAAGGGNWPEEFKRFRERPENYKDTLLILSKGPYSALPAEETPYGAGEWEEISLTIRMYHELTHMVCRSLYPDRVDVLWDEILADCFGILKAVGVYDRALAQKCLGVYGGRYRPGGRLENYMKDGRRPDEEDCRQVLECIEALSLFLQERADTPYWELLCLAEEQKEEVNKIDRMKL